MERDEQPKSIQQDIYSNLPKLSQPGGFVEQGLEKKLGETSQTFFEYVDDDWQIDWSQIKSFRD